jgi:hypothetical protein
MNTCPLCFVQWSGYHHCTPPVHTPTTYNYHNHTQVVEGCFRRDLSRDDSAHVS